MRNKYFYNKYSKILFSLIVAVGLLSGCGGGSSAGSNTSPTETPTQPPGPEDKVTQNDILQDYKVELLKDETYYFPANTRHDKKIAIQPLKQFDMIFVGYEDDNSDDSNQFISKLIPGTYIHILMYLGKDSDGYAYGIEMNTEDDAKVKFENNELSIKGEVYIYCLGSDYNKECPVAPGSHNINRYDYMWAKQFDPQLKERLVAHKESILETIKSDLQNKFPYQIPLSIDSFNKILLLINDSRLKGTDCASYISSLFEEKAGVCMDDIQLKAEALTDYYINDPKGQEVYLPAADNPYGIDVYISDLLTTYGFKIENNTPRKTSCPDKRQVVGIPTPQKIFESPSLSPIAVSE